MIELIREDKGAGLALRGNEKELAGLRAMLEKAAAEGYAEKIKIKNTVGAKIAFRFSLAGHLDKPADDIDDLLG